jgi:peptidyl-prolyl cis-trans isomerase A (cyclophilin A)
VSPDQSRPFEEISMRGGRLLSVLGLFALVLTAVTVCAEEGSKKRAALPDDLPAGWYAWIQTSEGRILARLLPEQAPQSVAHFVAFAEGSLEWIDPVTGEMRKGPLYDGTRVHFVKAGARFEAGSPTGEGYGGPTVWVPHNEGYAPLNFHTAGRLGMTAGPGKLISAHQFFVTAAAQPFMSGKFPCFGTVVSGQDVVLKITTVKAHPNGRPKEPVTIKTIRIFRRGNPPPLAELQPFRPQKEDAMFEAAPSVD